MTHIDLPRPFHNRHQIEVGIAETLMRGEPAELERAAVEEGYKLIGVGGLELDRTVDDKCTAILDVLKIHYHIAAHYMVVGGSIIFSML